MTWSAPMTAVAGSVFTAAQFNTFVRDNLLECPAAKAFTPGALIAVTDTNQVDERVPSAINVNTSETTTSTSYVALATAGPAVTVTTGINAIVMIVANVANNTSGQNAYASYDVTGASSISATDDRAQFINTAAVNQTFRATMTYFETALTPGSNTFTAKYRVTGGTGTFSNRRIAVVPL